MKCQRLHQSRKVEILLQATGNAIRPYVRGELLSTTELQQLITQGSKPTLSTSALLAANDAFVIFPFFPDFLSRDMQ
jgi:hypothetical protein